MSIKTLLLFVLIMLLNTAACNADRLTFYLDSINGNDSNTGQSPKQAWKTLEKASQTIFVPGSKILLKRGCTFTGCLNLKGSGTPQKQNIAGAYGKGAKPILQSTGGASVILDNVEYWTVQDLEISGGNLGVLVHMQDFGPAHKIKLLHLGIKDINGGTVGDNGGILCINSGESTIFDDLLIEGCNITHADRNGILITDYPNATDKHRSKNVVIRGNKLTDIGGDGIFILACKGAVIEKNVVKYAHQRVGRNPGERACAGLWPHRCDDTLIQFNEVAYTAVGGKTIWDSEGYDDDISCTGSVFQYNYSHDNAGGFMLFCGGKDTVVRYNMSVNDGTASFTFELNETQNSRIYNNTIFVKDGIDVELVRNTFGTPKNVKFTNNIFYIKGKAAYSFRGIRDINFDHNLYFGNIQKHPSDLNAVTSDPMLINPARYGNGFDTLRGFKLKPASPCIDAGQKIKNNGGRDFWGASVGGKQNIGASE